MAAGPITLIIKDSKGYERTARFWSDDGTTGGALTPIHQLDAAQLAEITDGVATLGTEVTLAEIRDKLITAPATAAKQDTVIASLSSIDGHVDGLEATSASILAKLSSDPATDTKLEAVRALLAGTLTAAPSTDQDPIFDHTNGAKVTLVANTSTDLITPPAGCKFIRISADADTFVATNNPTAAADDGKSIRIIANQPEIIPVVAGVKVKGISTSAAVVRITPMKVR